MFCADCGQANAEAARFCTACGRSLQSAQAPAEDAAQPTPPYQAAVQPPAVPSATDEMAAESPLVAGNPAQNDRTPPPPVFQAPPPMMTPAAPAAPVIASTPCRVCGVTLPAYRSECPRCGTPVGMIVNASDPTANSYVPVNRPAMSALSARPGATVNTSGTHAPMPAQLQSGWNWGAAFVTYLWAITHRAWWYVALQTILSVGLIAMLAITRPGDQTMNLVSGICTIVYCVVYIIYRIYFGMQGNRLAWRYRRFDSANQCLEVQEAWKPAGIAFGIIAMLIGAVLGVLFVLGIIGGAIASMAK